MGDPVYPREEYASDRQWWMSRVRRLVHWPWFSVPLWILLPLAFVIYTAPIAAALSAVAWLVFGVPFWLAWLLVDAGVLLYLVYGFLRIRHQIGPGRPGRGGRTPPRPGGPNPRPPRGRWWRRPDGGGVREPPSPRSPRPSLSSPVDPDDPTTGQARGAAG